jgi:hypothetical protein
MFNLSREKIIGVNFCFTTKKLKFEFMHQHHAHPSFEVLATLAGMRRSGNTAGNSTKLRI